MSDLSCAQTYNLQMWIILGLSCSKKKKKSVYITGTVNPIISSYKLRVSVNNIF